MNSKVILIVGATSMIGTACVHLLAKRKLELVLLGRDIQRLEALLKESKASAVYVTDVASESEITACVNEVLSTYGRIDAVIYNAAIYPWKNIESLSLQEWHATMDVNLTGAFLITKACISFMKEQHFGRVVFISSIAGETIGLPHMSVYGASKAGLNGFMRTASLELAPFNITVNSVSPGKVYDVSMLTHEEVHKKIRPIPLGRFVDPEDIAHMVDFLISDKAKNITGQNFVIDGGQSILGEEAS
jgi:3-oxoacyl-[acyl-carrier protein] reductase